MPWSHALVEGRSREKRLDVHTDVETSDERHAVTLGGFDMPISRFGTLPWALAHSNHSPAGVARQAQQDTGHLNREYPAVQSSTQT